MTDAPETTPPAGDRLSQVLLCVLALTLPTQFAYEIKRVNPDGGITAIASPDVGFLALVLCFLIVAGRLLIRRNWREVLWPTAPCLALAVVGALAALHSSLIADQLAEAGSVLKAPLTSVTVKRAASEWVQLVAYAVLAYFVLVNLLKESRLVRCSLYLILTLASVAVLLALRDLALAPEAKYVRASLGHDASFFSSQNTYSGFLALLFPMALGLLLYTRSLAVRLWLGAFIVLGMVTMVGAGGWLATLIVLPLTAFRLDRRAGWATVAVIGVLIALLGGTGQRAYRQGLGELAAIDDSDGDVKKQLVEWQAGLDMLNDQFLFGVGTGLYQMNIGAYYGALPNKEKMPWDSNNLYLVTASTMGIVGLVALLYFLLHPLLQAGRLARAAEGEARVLLSGAWGGILAFAVVSLLNSLWVRGTAPVLVYLISIVGLYSSTQHPQVLQEETHDPTP